MINEMMQDYRAPDLSLKTAVEHDFYANTRAARLKGIGDNDGCYGEYGGLDRKSSDDNLLAYIILVMLAVYNLEQQRAVIKGKEIEHDSKRARDTQDMANRVDEVINNAAKGDNKSREKLPEEVIKYMRDNGLTVDGMTIDEYIEKNGEKDGDNKGALDKGGLQAVKAALDNSVNRDTDLSPPNQLQLNKLIQMCNTTLNMATDAVNKLFSLLQTVSQIGRG